MMVHYECSNPADSSASFFSQFSFHQLRYHKHRQLVVHCIPIYGADTPASINRMTYRHLPRIGPLYALFAVTSPYIAVIDKFIPSHLPISLVFKYKEHLPRFGVLLLGNPFQRPSLPHIAFYLLARTGPEASQIFEKNSFSGYRFKKAAARDVAELAVRLPFCSRHSQALVLENRQMPEHPHGTNHTFR